MYCIVSGTLVGYFFSIYFYKDCIGSDTFDTFEGNYILYVSAEHAADASGTRYDKRLDTSAAYIKFNITHCAKNLAVTGVDDIFISKLAYSHNISTIGFI